MNIFDHGIIQTLREKRPNFINDGTIDVFGDLVNGSPSINCNKFE